MNDNIFQYGATWLRADFHLHTKADKEFGYFGEENLYYSSYVDALIAADISIGIITNHNKFDFEEFKGLRSATKKKGIFLLPGVELSVNDGANGIHVLIAFADSWIDGGQDRVSPFLTTMFPGKTPAEYQNANARSDKNILQVVEELQKIGRDYFFVFAHVEDAKGLWEEMKGGKLSDWATDRYAEVRRSTLGFQKIRTRDDREKVKQWLGDWYPAEVEGSDAKNVAEIGKGKSCFLKLGAFTFDAVKFALLDHKNRLRMENPQYTHSHINRIRFEGGRLDGQTICFSPELNALIGIRGSGKSSVLEVLRYALDIRIEPNDSDSEYKQKLVERTLKSGGKVVLDATDQHGQIFQIQRILHEGVNVFVDGKLQPGILTRETILRKPLFFGQKELSSSGKDSEKDLIEKLLGTKCDDIRRKIADQNTQVAAALDKLLKVSNVNELIAEQSGIKQDAEFRLEFYKKHNLEEKLQKRLGYEADIRKAKEGIDVATSFVGALRELLANHEDELRNFPGYISADNADFFKEFDTQFQKIIVGVDAVKSELSKAMAVLAALETKYNGLLSAKQGLADEFATIERTLAAELKMTNDQNISSDEFLSLKRKLSAAEKTLELLSKSDEQKTTLQNELYIELQRLNELWHEEFTIIKNKLEEVSQKNAALKFSVGFKEDKATFLAYFKSIFKGSGVRDATFQNIVGTYQDFVGIYLDFENAKRLFGTNPESFVKLFSSNLQSLLTYQAPNKFTIHYRGVELAHHSLGQRVSALILFVLGQQENDVIIIDQPEDDLDNQTIYEDVIKLICALKPKVQFIFATHNPNIPVLGDAEQIHACSFADDTISIRCGGLDNPEQQKRIVNIMEGGEEAFEKRKEIYRIWKP